MLPIATSLNATFGFGAWSALAMGTSAGGTATGSGRSSFEAAHCLGLVRFEPRHAACVHRLMTRPRADTMLAIHESRFVRCFQGQGCELPLYQGLLKKTSMCLSMPSLVRFVMVGMHGFGLRSHRQCTWTILQCFPCMTITRDIMTP